MHNEISDEIQTLRLFYPMQLEKYFNLPEENIIYEVPKDDQIIEELAYLFRNTDEEDTDVEEVDDSREIPVISNTTATASLDTVRTYLLQ